MPPHHGECGCKMTRRDSSQENRDDRCKEWQGSPRTGARLVRWRAFAPGTVSGLGVAQPRLPPSPRSRNGSWGRAASIVVYAFTDMLRSSKTPGGHLVIPATLALCVFATPVSGQDRRWVVFGTAGVASIGHADSEQGKAPVVGGGAAFQMVRWLLLEGDVHGARVRHVFGREHHDFSELTLTGSLLFRTSPERRAHFVGGAGLALQRARIEFDVPPVGHVDRTETLRLTHGRAGVEWDVSGRVLIRSEAVLWLGDGLDWVLGGRVGVGYRF